jgi:hypothetical protein
MMRRGGLGPLSKIRPTSTTQIQYLAEVAGCKMLATQDAKTEILVETGNCPDLGGCRWPMTRRLWTGEGS